MYTQKLISLSIRYRNIFYQIKPTNPTTTSNENRQKARPQNLTYGAESIFRLIFNHTMHSMATRIEIDGTKNSILRVLFEAFLYVCL